MNLPLSWHSLGVLVAAIACVAFAVGDLWQFHALAKDTSLSIFYIGIAALGVTSAYSAGLNSDPVGGPPPAPKPVLVQPAPAPPPAPIV